MNCELCKKQIQQYEPRLNHLQIDETHSVDICLECIDKFLKWQQGIFARLFPTSAVKKKYRGK